MKKENYGAVAKWDATRPSAKTAAHKAIGGGARKTIVNNTQHKKLYEKAMKEESGLLSGQKVLKHLNGKKAPEHKSLTRRLLKGYGRYVGIALGDKIGGPLGAIVGSMVGDKLSHVVDKRFGKTYFESKAGKKMIELAASKSPRVKEELENELKKWGVKVEFEKELKKYEEQKNVKRKEYKEKKKSILEGNKKVENEEYIPDEKLPIIKMGHKPKNKTEKGLPIIR
jgi:hypothetical protein